MKFFQTKNAAAKMWPSDHFSTRTRTWKYDPLTGWGEPEERYFVADWQADIYIQRFLFGT